MGSSYAAPCEELLPYLRKLTLDDRLDNKLNCRSCVFNSRCISLLGPRKSGKTTFVYHLQQKLLSESRVGDPNSCDIEFHWTSWPKLLSVGPFTAWQESSPDANQCRTSFSVESRILVGIDKTNTQRRGETWKILVFDNMEEVGDSGRDRLLLPAQYVAVRRYLEEFLQVHKQDAKRILLVTSTEFSFVVDLINFVYPVVFCRTSITARAANFEGSDSSTTEERANNQKMNNTHETITSLPIYLRQMDTSGFKEGSNITSSFSLDYEKILSKICFIIQQGVQNYEFNLKRDEEVRKSDALHMSSPLHVKCSSSAILLHGPSGCGKTRMIYQLQSRFPHVNFLLVSSPLVFSPYFGDSERNIRTAFRVASTRVPCVLVFDEIDLLGQKRSSETEEKSSTSVRERLLSQLLCEMDGFGENLGATKGMWVIGLTNRDLQHLDSALLRPGRFDKILTFHEMQNAR